MKKAKRRSTIISGKFIPTVSKLITSNKFNIKLTLLILNYELRINNRS